MQKRRLTVVHITNSSVRSEYLISLARHFNKDEFRLVVGCFDSPGPLHEKMKEMGIETFCIPCAKERWLFTRVFKLRKQLRIIGPDILHLHTFWPSLVGVIVGRLMRIPLVVYTRHHADFHLRYHRPIHTILDRLTARLAHQVIAVSKFTKEVMVEREKISANKVKLVESGIDIIQPRKGFERGHLLEELGLGRNSYLMLMVARIHPEKNIEVAIRAISLIREKTEIDAHLLIAGDGVGSDYHNKLLELADSEGVTGYVRFLGWRDDIGELLTGCDVFIQTSRAESFGFAALEAMALGCAIVASDIPTTHEILTSEVAWIFGPEEYAVLAARVKNVFSEAEERNRRLKLGLKLFEEKFTAKIMVNRYEQIYRSWMNA